MVVKWAKLFVVVVVDMQICLTKKSGLRGSLMSHFDKIIYQLNVNGFLWEEQNN